MNENLNFINDRLTALLINKVLSFGFVMARFLLDFSSVSSTYVEDEVLRRGWLPIKLSTVQDSGIILIMDSLVFLVNRIENSI